MDSERLTITDLRAALDQAGAALRDVADTLGAYRQDLVASGFDPDEALELCIDVQRAVLFGSDTPLR